MTITTVDREASGNTPQALPRVAHRHLVIAAVLACTAYGAFATTPPVGDQAGNVLVRVHVLGVFPEDSSSKIDPIGGKVDISDRVAPEVDLSYFVTDHIAAQLIATMTRPSIKAKDTALGDVKVGAVTVLPPTLTGQYHFAPHQAFNPYLGAGVAAFILFAKHSAGPPVTRLHTDSHLGAAVQAGFDCDFAPRWLFNAEIDQVFVKTHAVIETTVGANPGPIPPASPGATVKAKTDVNPFLVGVGVGYRF